MLDNGGGIILEDDAELSPISIFNAEENTQSIKKIVDVFNLLIRRYRYLQKSFEDAISRMMRFLNRFTTAECNKLALAYTYFFITQMAPMSLLEVLFMDHLVKEGHSLQFITTIFKTFLQEQSIDHLTSMLKKNGLDDKLLEFFPVSKRTDDFLSRHFTTEGLPEVASYHEKRIVVKQKAEFKENLQKLITEQSPLPDGLIFIKQHRGDVPDPDLIPLIWQAIMDSVEWNRRVEQCEEQACKQAKEWGKLLSNVINNAKTEMTLILALQTFCYEDQRFTKIFAKLVQIFYKLDILSETAIVYWHTKGAAPKGKAVFTQQLDPFVKWLNEAAEESD